jgi:Domain of unknown function (DUF1918)
VEAQVGDRITIESNRVGGGSRTGEIVEVIEAADTKHYRIRWDDGHESVYYPSAGAGVARSGR